VPTAMEYSACRNENIGVSTAVKYSAQSAAARQCLADQIKECIKSAIRVIPY